MEVNVSPHKDSETNACGCVCVCGGSVIVPACMDMRGREHLVSYLFMEATGRLWTAPRTWLTSETACLLLYFSPSVIMPSPSRLLSFVLGPYFCLVPGVLISCNSQWTWKRCIFKGVWHNVEGNATFFFLFWERQFLSEDRTAVCAASFWWLQIRGVKLFLFLQNHNGFLEPNPSRCFCLFLCCKNDQCGPEVFYLECQMECFHLERQNLEGDCTNSHSVTF